MLKQFENLFELLKFSLFKFPEEYANEWFYQGEIK
jgi:hypothetical protein